MSDISFDNEVAPDGQARYVPHGLRIIESILLEKFDADDVKVCFADQLHRFVGADTRVVGIHAHNPLGITFATDVYTHLYGRYVEPVNAAEFRRLITHPVFAEAQASLEAHRRRPRFVADRKEESSGRMADRLYCRRRGGRRRARSL